MIRSFYNVDLEQLIEVLQLNIPQNFAPSELSDFKSYIRNHQETYFVLEKDKNLVGGFGYEVLDVPSIVAIKWIFTHPSHKGTGLGRKAVEYCLQLFRNKKEIHTVMVDTSQLASEFFEKFGFTVILTEKNHWGEGLDLVRMRSSLS